MGFLIWEDRSSCMSDNQGLRRGVGGEVWATKRIRIGNRSRRDRRKAGLSERGGKAYIYY